MIEDFENSASVVTIDPLALDKECIRLPSDYLKFAHMAANTKAEVDRLESKLKVVHAELSRDIRATPTDYGLDKVTETALAAAVITQPRYLKIQEILQRAQHKNSLAQAVVWALEHKKRSLTLLVELHGLSYSSNVKLSEKGKEAVEEMTKRQVRRNRFADPD